MMKKRLDLKLGYSCNNNCLFCVVANKRIFKDRTTEELKLEMKEARKDCDAIVFTGGEVSLRKDIVDLVGLAKDIGYKTIQIQTNGRLLSSRKFCEELINGGATEFSPAIHGHTPKVHDFLTRVPGSFEQTIKGIKNLKLLKQKIITNTVVVKPNYSYLSEIAELLVKLNVDQFQFAFVHPLGNAWNNFDSIVPLMSAAAPFIRKGLDIGIKAGVRCMVEAVPFCILGEGYANFVSENYIPPTEVREAVGFTKDFTKLRKEEGKLKFKKCALCKFDVKCEGPWREYPLKRGGVEFNPIR